MNPKIITELESVVGPRYVLSQPAEVLVYSFDSALDRSTPSLVVLPGTQAELNRVVKILATNRTPFVARGAGTSLCGGPVPLANAVVIGLARMNKIGQLDKTKREISVEPGVVNLHLQNVLDKEGLFFPPDPGSQKACTIGGNVAMNAGGPHCLKYGVTTNNVVGMDVILPDGQQVRLTVDDPGYDLLGFFVGSEGTLGIASNIRLKLLPKPKFVRTMVVSFSSIEEAIQSVADIIAAGILPATLEAMDKTIVAAVEAFVHAGYPLEAEAVLLIEVDGNEPSVLDEQVSGIQRICEKNGSFDFRFAKDDEERRKLWEGRRGSYAAMARLAPNVLVEDGAVPRSALPEALRRIKEIADEAGVQVALLFHAGDGNLHPQIIFDERDKQQTKAVKDAGYRMLKACVDLGGTISGEHGIGIDKREAMRWLFSRETLSLFRRLKIAFDPSNFCNPDKLIPLISKAEEKPIEKKSDSPESVAAWEKLAPATPEEAISIVRNWAATRRPFGVQGTKSKYPVNEENLIETSKLDKILEFDKGNLSVTVQAGCPVSSVRAVVEAQGQYLWVAGEGSVGGAIATRSSVSPPLRDQILGMRVLLPTGEVVVFGAKTMKNVAGYDAAKLLIGSWGTLGIILDVTFRLFPFPAAELKTQAVKPFVFKELHKRIKAAFDPNGHLNRRLSNMNEQDVKAGPPDTTTLSGIDWKKLEDKFWT